MNLGELIQRMKDYVIYERYSDERLLNDLLECLVVQADLRHFNCDESLYFDKSYTSKILRNKASIPPQLREAAKNQNIRASAYKSFSKFYCKHIDDEKGKQIKESLLEDLACDHSFSKTAKDTLICLEDCCEFLFSYLLLTLEVENNRNKAIHEHIVYEKGNNHLNVVVGDLFKFAFQNRRKNKTIVVIPVNTRFDMHLSTKIEKTPNPMISSETIHGEWLSRLKKSGEDPEFIKRRIIEDLLVRGIKPNADNEYPIGTIASVDFDNTCFFLLAISSFDSYNRASSDSECVREAVDNLIEYYDINGQGYEMYVPLLGTGRSRANLSFQESFDIIKSSVLRGDNTFVGKITVVVTKKASEDIIIRGEADGI